MFRAAVRSTPRAALQRVPIAPTAGRRFASTAPPPADKKYSWKGLATRGALAFGALYWYNTSPIFADELSSRLSPEPPHFSESDLPTVDAIVEEKRKKLDARLNKAKQEETSAAATPTSTAPPSNNDNTSAVASDDNGEKTPEQLEEEASQQGAFNPETGEINWDCPCLGGMAHGPCGEEFKAAFSCFVYSNVEPKGMDCIDKFQHMQDCFRQYPDIYAREIADEDATDAEIEAPAAGDVAAVETAPAASDKPVDTPEKPTEAAPATQAKSEESTKTPEPSKPEVPAKKESEPTTEEHKAGPPDAPKKEAPSKPSPAPEAVNSSGSSPKQSQDSHLDLDSRGLPKRSFDATQANKESK
ncbi:hypothetical protein BD289DRAFT_465095 [Coniella lustricola]|uniref:Mitochondrial intermembrane space import and assembly protein 40 n=1 Tax=Coniella lustricola TaxID=2025994 RepID=A0A2T3AJE8_9PEZI|nr:hypothetical protein BD289DRAFT_465095 [Coniella lustricola]